MSLLDELERLIAEARARLAEMPVYVPMSDEADIRPMLDEVIKTHRLFLPVIEGGKLAFRQATDLDTLVPGPFQIPEPPLGNPLLDVTQPAIVLVPGRAFDRKGDRMGRGNGGYDIWIRAARKANTAVKFWGIALECQIVQDVPLEAHDEKVDAIVTARGKEEIS